MGLGERIIEAFGGVTAAQLDDIRNRAYEAGYYDGNDDPASGDIKQGGQGYRKISDKFVREGKVDYDTALETAWNLWQKSPIAKRVLAMKRDHIIGHGAMPTAEDDELVEVIKDFWMTNKLDKRASQFVAQLFGFGEQCFPAFVKESTGQVKLGYIDPRSIMRVVKHRDNSLEDWAVVIGYGNPVEYKVYRIIREDENYIDETTAALSKYSGMMVTAEQATIEPWELEMIAEHKPPVNGQQPEYDGSCFYYKVNAVSNQTRGMSDLLQVADWIDQADEVLFALAEREQFAGYFSWDVTVTGADEERLDKRADTIRKRPPKKGSVNIHNESEIWTFNSPNLNQTGTIETFRAILGLILGGMGFPVHWYGFGDDANRATAVAQSDPTSKSLEHDQGTVKSMFLQMCQFAIDQAIIAGELTDLDNEEYELILDLPEVTTKDLGRVSASLNGLVSALSTAKVEGWISDQTAVMTFAKALRELDIDIDPAEELENAAAEKEERDMAEQEKQNNALKQMMANGANGNGVPMNGNGRNGQQRMKVDNE